jgi:hypothetical protein
LVLRIGDYRIDLGTGAQPAYLAGGITNTTARAFWRA